MSPEDRIRKLCSELVECREEQRLKIIAAELQYAIRERIESLRLKLQDISVVSRRRKQKKNLKE